MEEIKESKPLFNFDKPKVDKDEINKHVDEILKNQIKVEDRVRVAHQIKKNPPKPGYMHTEVPPGVYAIDLNTDAHWWFNHVCTVFPFLLDQGIRTHVDLKDSFKPEKRLPDFNYMFIVLAVMGVIAIVGLTKAFGWW